jgi:hypothetical protein
MNYEPASAGDTIARVLPSGTLPVCSHPVRKSSGQGWGTRRSDVKYRFVIDMASLK